MTKMMLKTRLKQRADEWIDHMTGRGIDLKALVVWLLIGKKCTTIIIFENKSIRR